MRRKSVSRQIQLFVQGDSGHSEAGIPGIDRQHSHIGIVLHPSGHRCLGPACFEVDARADQLGILRPELAVACRPLHIGAGSIRHFNGIPASWKNQLLGRQHGNAVLLIIFKQISKRPFLPVRISGSSLLIHLDLHDIFFQILHLPGRDLILGQWPEQAEKACREDKQFRDQDNAPDWMCRCFPNQLSNRSAHPYAHSIHSPFTPALCKGSHRICFSLLYTVIFGLNRVTARNMS